MRNKIYLILILLSFIACKTEKNTTKSLSRIEGKQLPISQDLSKDDQIEAYIKPYREKINKQMDSILGYAPVTLSKTDSEYNTGIGNMMADAVMEMAAPIVKQRTGKTIDAVLLNHGGIRSILPKGNVTTRTAYDLMPFENEVVVVELTGKKVQELFTYLEYGRAHPISGMQIILGADGKLKSGTIQGKSIDPKKTYFIATSDYLKDGGDHMDFFADAVSYTTLDYKIRNILIDYFKKHDTITGVQDNRFIKE